MDLREFRQKYKLSNSQLAEIAGCGKDLVDRWFVQSDSRKEPSPEHIARLELAEWLWESAEKEPELIRKLRAMKASIDDKKAKSAKKSVKNTKK